MAPKNQDPATETEQIDRLYQEVVLLKSVMIALMRIIPESDDDYEHIHNAMVSVDGHFEVIREAIKKHNVDNVLLAFDAEQQARQQFKRLITIGIKNAVDELDEQEAERYIEPIRQVALNAILISINHETTQTDLLSLATTVNEANKALMDVINTLSYRRDALIKIASMAESAGISPKAARNGVAALERVINRTSDIYHELANQLMNENSRLSDKILRAADELETREINQTTKTLQQATHQLINASIHFNRVNGAINKTKAREKWLTQVNTTIKSLQSSINATSSIALKSVSNNTTIPKGPFTALASTKNNEIHSILHAFDAPDKTSQALNNAMQARQFALEQIKLTKTNQVNAIMGAADKLLKKLPDEEHPIIYAQLQGLLTLTGDTIKKLGISTQQNTRQALEVHEGLESTIQTLITDVDSLIRNNMSSLTKKITGIAAQCHSTFAEAMETIDAFNRTETTLTAIQTLNVAPFDKTWDTLRTVVSLEDERDDLCAIIAAAGSAGLSTSAAEITLQKLDNLINQASQIVHWINTESENTSAKLAERINKEAVYLDGVAITTESNDFERTLHNAHEILIALNRLIGNEDEIEPALKTAHAMLSQSIQTADMKVSARQSSSDEYKRRLVRIKTDASPTTIIEQDFSPIDKAPKR